MDTTSSSVAFPTCTLDQNDLNFVALSNMTISERHLTTAQAEVTAKEDQGTFSHDVPRASLPTVEKIILTKIALLRTSFYGRGLAPLIATDSSI